NIEERDVEDPDRPTLKRKVSCLVVRLRHPEGKPVLVRPPWRYLGEEHRFYEKAGKYTALFWPVTLPQALKSLQELEVVSLEGFRERARELGQHAVLDGLGEPNFSDVRPQPQ